MEFPLPASELSAGNTIRVISSRAADPAEGALQFVQPEMESRMRRPSGVVGWLKTILPWLLLAVLLLLPKTNPSDNLIRLLFITAVWTTTSLGWNLLGGMAGQVSFGFAVFFGLGAYTTALLMHAGHSPRSEEHTSELQSHVNLV